MYSLSDKPSYKSLWKGMNKYSELSKIYGCGSETETEIQDTPQESTKDASSSVDTSAEPPKKRGPEINAADYDVGYITTANNREFIVKEVNGKGGKTYKRWILNK